MPLDRATDGRGNAAGVMRRFYSRNRSDRIHGIILRQVSVHVHPQISEASRVGFPTLFSRSRRDLLLENLAFDSN
jgi:hypothetical protein